MPRRIRYDRTRAIEGRMHRYRYCSLARDPFHAVYARSWRVFL